MIELIIYMLLGLWIVFSIWNLKRFRKKIKLNTEPVTKIKKKFLAQAFLSSLALAIAIAVVLIIYENLR